MVANRQMCSELADLVTRHLVVIGEELDRAAKGDAEFTSLVEDYTEYEIRSV
jgi:hypothetical protein